MKKFLTAIVFCMCAAFVCGAQSLYHGLSYTQRGILEIDGNETPVTIFVRSFGNKTAMQMESQFGMLCRIEVDNEGNPTLLEGSPIFRISWVRKFVLRDFLTVLGKKPHTASSGGNHIIGFSNYRTLEKSQRSVPFEIRIHDTFYNISLTSISIKE
jgi:hypothetical protein